LIPVRSLLFSLRLKKMLKKCVFIPG